MEEKLLYNNSHLYETKTKTEIFKAICEIKNETIKKDCGFHAIWYLYYKQKIFKENLQCQRKNSNAHLMQSI